jgi:thiol:disulfide interchange protein
MLLSRLPFSQLTSFFSLPARFGKTVLLGGLCFLFALLTALVSGIPSAAPVEGADARFAGLRHATPKEIRTVLPENTRRPVLLEFTSRFCGDCRRMAPVVARLAPRYPQVSVRRLDVQEDREKAPAVFRAFQPVSVPVLVFIAPNGVIRDVLYNEQPPERIAAAFRALQGARP